MTEGAEQHAEGGERADASYTPESAAAKLTELRADAAWMDSYFSGDKAKAAEFTGLHEVAYPKGAAEVQANAEIFAAPSTPLEYDFRIADPDLDKGIREALHAEGMPASAVHLAQQLIERNGELDDEGLEEARRAGWSELERRHGKKDAAALLADAKKVYDRLVKRQPAIGDWLEANGAASDWNLIETLARLHRVQAATRA